MRVSILPQMLNLPSPDVMYRAVVEHDPAFEGIFYVGVATTGIFSRPRRGFELARVFGTAFTRLVGAPPSRASGVDCLYAHWLETPLGAMLALADDSGLALLEFVDRRGLERELETLQRRLERRILP